MCEDQSQEGQSSNSINDDSSQHQAIQFKASSSSAATPAQPQHNPKRKNTSTSSVARRKDDNSYIYNDNDNEKKAAATTSTPEPNNMTSLPYGFYPSSSDIIVGTGREARNHKGNKNFKEVLQPFIGRYSEAHFKLDKTLIISEIVESVKEKSPTKTGFIKKIGSKWYAVDDHLSREKVSQSLRNILHGQYKSSAKAKKRRRSKICSEIDNNIGRMLQTKESFLSTRIDRLSTEMKSKGNDASEADVFAMFSRANIDILENLKKDVELQSRIESSIKAPSDAAMMSSDPEESEEEESAEFSTNNATGANRRRSSYDANKKTPDSA